MDGQKLWASILSDIKSQVPSSTFKTWFSGSVGVDLEKDEASQRLVVGIRNSFLKQQLETKYKTVITEAAKRKGVGETEVVFVIKQAQKRVEESSNVPLFSGVAPTYINVLRKVDTLNPTHTFENFVVGSTNNLAYLAFSQVAGNPGSVYNPLFVWGPTGVGKTHLLQACGNDILNKIQDVRVIYVSAEKFTNDYIESIGNRTTAAFRQKYRGADVLLVDDVQFFAGKESTQDEFFYTFNELHLSGRQIVLASDKHPAALARIQGRLLSRFTGGLAVDVGCPDFELRLAILRAKCNERGLQLADEILGYIAQSCQEGVRELEGTLINVLSLAKLAGGDISLEQIKSAVERNKVASVEKPSSGKVFNAVCQHYKITKEELCGPRRKARIVVARQALMFLLRNDLKLPLNAIGELVGGRDHSTVLHSVDKVGELVENDQGWRDEITRIRQSL